MEQKARYALLDESGYCLAIGEGLSELKLELHSIRAIPIEDAFDEYADYFAFGAEIEISKECFLAYSDIQQETALKRAWLAKNRAG